jgi:hypothetical protein
MLDELHTRALPFLHDLSLTPLNLRDDPLGPFELPLLVFDLNLQLLDIAFETRPLLGGERDVG